MPEEAQAKQTVERGEGGDPSVRECTVHNEVIRPGVEGHHLELALAPVPRREDRDLAQQAKPGVGDAFSGAEPPQPLLPREGGDCAVPSRSSGTPDDNFSNPCRRGDLNPHALAGTRPST